MAYSPLQARGRDGKWIATGTNAAVAAAKAGISGGKTKKPRTKPKAQRGARGVGVKGLKANFTPYTRVNKRSQTIGVNTGTLIPKTHKRIAVGAYARLENTRNKTAADRFVDKHVKKVLPGHTKRGKVAGYLRKNVALSTPAVRATAKGHQVRLGTSRGAGPTVIVRRGKHKTAIAKSQKGIDKYDKRIRTISAQRAGKKAKRYKARPQRRRAARKKS